MRPDQQHPRRNAAGTPIPRGFLGAALLVAMVILAMMPAWAHANQPIRVAVINPLGPKDPFWANTIAFMADAARDLGVTLEVHHANGNPGKMVQIAKGLVARADPPRYLLYKNERNAGVHILGIAEQAGVNSILIMGGLSPEDTKIHGGPRQKYRRWLGEVVGDDFRGGYALAKTLVKNGGLKRLHDGNRLGMHILMNSREDPLTQLRYLGMQRALNEADDAVLGQLGFTDWDYKKSLKETERVFQKWSGARLYAAESEIMALAISNTITKRSRLQVNVDILLGSFGWSKLSFTSAAKSQITTVMGGHFIAGAAAVLLAHDHARGQDFAQKGVSYKITQGVVNRDNVRRIAPLLLPKNWKKLDFRKFSHFYFQQRKKYDFSIVTFLKEIVQPS